MCRGVYPLTPELPFIPGQEVSGVVTETGEGVDSSLVGRRVMGVAAFYAGWGGFATETLAAAATVYDCPDEIDDVDAAAFFIPFHTAWIALHQRAGVAEGETLVVLGAAGGSGAAAVQVGAALGARVVAVVGGPAKGEFCRRMGAAVVVDHTASDVTESLLDTTSGRGAEVVFDPVGGAPAKAALGAIANEGRFLLVGFASGEWAQPKPADMVHRNFSTVGVYAGAYDRDYSETAHERLVSMWSAGEIHRIVTETVNFEEVPVALARIAARSSIGRVVMTTS
jgi:NADPH2:quinone reductase